MNYDNCINCHEQKRFFENKEGGRISVEVYIHCISYQLTDDGRNNFRGWITLKNETENKIIETHSSILHTNVSNALDYITNTMKHNSNKLKNDGYKEVPK